MLKESYTRVQDFVIPIYNYRYFHKPSGELKAEDDPNHVDRKNLINTILDLLNTKIFAGVYLITGFRGSGKTSLVKRAVLRFTQKSNYFDKYYVIETNLSGAGLTSFDVLKNITWAIFNKYSSKTELLIMRYIWLLFIGIISYFTLSELIAFDKSTIHLIDATDREPTRVIHALLDWTFKADDNWLHVYVALLLIGTFFILYYLFSFLAGMLDIDPYHRRNLSRLRELNNRISSNESRRQSKIKFMEASFDTDQKRNTKDLTEKEISFELEQIISDAQSRKLIKVHFIFIIDELDKIELTTETQTATAADQVKKKKDRIFQLLGELKQFFVNTKAKFFCITGAEMYDASLADITERDSYLGSIFHRVIYVPSFFSDFDNHSSDITNQTEQFICQFLCPERKCTSLKEYFEYYLQINSKHSIQRQVKLYFILQSFIGYLTFRAKGSPKKIVTLFEENLIRKKDFLRDSEGDPEFYLDDEKERESLQDATSRYFLHFDEFDQYKIGLTSVLNSPFLYSYSLFITNHSDKLIISSSFLWDHIHKYHSAAFSEHHLEYIHELISNTKDPETKKQLTYLLSLLKGRCVREIRSGLFDYKFTSRLKNEIAFLSNVIQTESAVYNFTLDEASNLKRYYQAKLDDAKKRFKESRQENPLLTGFLARTIGDLYFYDQEYDQAIIYYEEALASYFTRNRKKMSSREWSNFMRWNLLLSLTYEKCGHYTKAFAICCDLKQESQNFIKGIKKKNKKWRTTERITTGEFFNQNKEIILYSKVFHHNTIQKLMLIEKTGLNGIKPSDVENAKAEFREIYGWEYEGEEPVGFEVAENVLIQSEIFHKINNILFFRNTGDNDELFDNDGDKGCYATIAQKYLVNIIGLIEKGKIRLATGKEGWYALLRKVLLHPGVLDFTNNDPNLNYALACADYFSKAGNALISVNRLVSFKDSEYPNTDIEFIRNLEEEYILKIYNKILENDLWAAFALYNRAGDIFAAVGYYGEAAEQYLKILYLIRNVLSTSLVSKITEVPIKKSVCLYCEKLTHKIFELQHKKDDNNARIFLQKYKAVQNKESYTEGESFSSQKSAEELFTLIKAFPNAPDLGETMLVFLEVVFKFDQDDYKKMVDTYMNLTNEDTIVQSQFVRLVELSFKGQYNYRKYETWANRVLGNKIRIQDYTCLDNMFILDEDYATIYQLCVDSIYCFLEVLRIISVQRNDFMIGHSVSASMYAKLAEWSTIRRALLHHTKDNPRLKETKEKYETKLRRQIHVQNVNMALSAKYNYEKSIEHFEKTEQTHMRGAPYREFIHHMYALEDDLNDEFTHFMLSLERMKFSRNIYKRQINSAKEALKRVLNKEAVSPRAVDTEVDWISNPKDFLRV